MNPVWLHSFLTRHSLRLRGLGLHRVPIDGETTIACLAPSKVFRNKSPRPALLLIHGFGGTGMLCWIHQVRACVAAGYDLYIPDLVFFGGSKSSSEKRSTQFQADSLVKLMDCLGVDKFALNGISYGGFVAYRIATAHPERVTRLILTNSGLLVSAEEQEAAFARLGVSSPDELLFPEDPAGVQRILDATHRHPPKLPRWLLRSILQVVFSGMVEERRQLLEHVRRERPANSSEYATPAIPTLVLWGRHDALFPFDVAVRMQRQFAAELVVLEDAGHFSLADQKADYNAAVLRFLGATGASSSSKSLP